MTNAHAYTYVELLMQTINSKHNIKIKINNMNVLNLNIVE